MILLIAFVVGAMVGWLRARHRGGDRLDKLQYGAVYGIVFALVVLTLLIIAQRLALI